jgi:hypothetical protein
MEYEIQAREVMKYIERLNKISVKGFLVAVIMLLIFLAIQFTLFYLKVLPTARENLSHMAGSEVVAYVDHILLKTFTGMWVWPLSFFALSALFTFVMHNVGKIISSESK